MIDAAFVAVLERLNDLDEGALDEFILAEERDLLYDRVKIAGAKIVYVEGVTALVDFTMEGENVGVGRDMGMDLSLASLIISFPSFLTRLTAYCTPVLVSTARYTTPNDPAPKMTSILRAPLSMVCPRNWDADAG